MAGSALLVGIFAAVLVWSGSSHDVMPPLPGKSESTAGPDAVIIIIPETGMSGADYNDLGRVIQQIYPLRLWVSLLDTSRHKTLTLDNLPLLLSESLQELAEAGMNKGEHIFLAAHGHSAGHVTADYSQAVPSSLRGLILLGTSLPKRFSLDSFPIPALTLVGELDGIVGITSLAQTIQSMILAHEVEPALATRSPIALLEGANHDVFSLGDLPPGLYTVDIEAEVDKNVAMTTASNLTAIFIGSVLNEPHGAAETAKQVFGVTFEHAKSLTQPMRSLMELTQDNRKSYWVKSAQKWLSGLEGQHSTQLEVDSYVVADDDPLPPTVVKENGIHYVITFSEIVHSLATDDTHGGMGPQAPDEIAARMMGPERIHEHLENTSIANNYTCRDLNYASFMTAYHTASDRARSRYNNYHRGVIFLPDIVTDSEALWESTKLKMETVGPVLHVTSISYQTANDQDLRLYAGLFFCKLLPPDRALEWIYVDSLRRTVSNPQDR